METSQVVKLLHKKFPSGQYALFTEVRNAAGFGADRSADAICMNLWPSRGLEVWGFEIKVSRADFMKELKDPKKAEAFMKYCDRWYLLLGDEKIADIAEVPPTWGLMVCKNNTIKTIREAPKLQAEPMSRSFIAAMFKRATASLIHPSTIQERIDAATAKAKSDLDWKTKAAADGYEKLRAQVQEFEQASGLRIRESWEYKISDLGAALKVIMNGGADKILKDLERISSQLVNITDRVQKDIDLIKNCTQPNEEQSIKGGLLQDAENAAGE